MLEEVGVFAPVLSSIIGCSTQRSALRIRGLVALAMLSSGCEGPNARDSGGVAPSISRSDIYAVQGTTGVDPTPGSVTEVRATCQWEDEILLTGACETSLEVPVVLAASGAAGMTTTAGVASWECAFINQGWDGTGDLNALATAYCVKAR